MKNEDVFSPKSKEELLSEFQLNRLRRWKTGNVSSERFVLSIYKKSSWSRTTLDCIIVGELRSHMEGTLVSFRIIPGLSSMLSFLMCLLALVSSITRTLILRNYAEELYAYVFLGVVSIVNILLLLLFIYRVKETRTDFLELLFGTRGS